MEFDLGQVIIQVVMLIAPIVIPLAVAWVAAGVRKLIANASAYYLAQTTEEQRATLEKLVHDAVLFAEQQGYVAAAQQIALDKKGEAIKWLDSALRAHGYVVDLNYLDGLIEAAVLDETRKGNINVEKATK